MFQITILTNIMYFVNLDLKISFLYSFKNNINSVKRYWRPFANVYSLRNYAIMVDKPNWLGIQLQVHVFWILYEYLSTFLPCILWEVDLCLDEIELFLLGFRNWYVHHFHKHFFFPLCSFIFSIFFSLCVCVYSSTHIELNWILYSSEYILWCIANKVKVNLLQSRIRRVW